jgi:Cof subfamily protein (haloacid dehalogenase superfamily)
MKPSQKIVFVDVDGTILSKDYEVHPAVAPAIECARRNGHLVYLCTGRPPMLLPPHVTVIEVDGGILTGGGLVNVGSQALFESRFTADETQEIIDYCGEHEISWLFTTAKYAFGNPGLAELFDLLFPDYRERQIFSLADPELFRHEEMLKVEILSNNKEVIETALNHFRAKFHVVTGTVPLPFGAQGELTPHGVTKGSAILTLLKHLNISPDNAIAIGDSYNDVEMFDVCGTTVAMGNAIEAIKVAADIVVGTVEEGGVAQALDRLGLI